MTKLFNLENMGVEIPKCHVMTNAYLGFGKIGSKFIEASTNKFSIKMEDKEILLFHDNKKGVKLYETGSFNHRINCKELIKCLQAVTGKDKPKFVIKKLSEGNFKLEY